MKQPPTHCEPTPAEGLASSRQARLQSLLFSELALETTMPVTAAASPKLPPFVGE